MLFITALNIYLRRDFLNWTLKAQTRRQIINGPHEARHLLYSNSTFIQPKQQLIEQENLFTNYMFARKLVFII